jgi:APA family basic amino acid/polyamine antiporter
MVNPPTQTWVRFGIWMAIGLAVYFLYGRTHSRLAPGKAQAQLRGRQGQEQEQGRGQDQGQGQG